MKALLDNGPILVRLELECFSDPWSEKSIADALTDDNYLVLIDANEQNSTVGYLIGRQIGAEAELDRIGVKVNARGLGIGKKLLDEALQIWHAHGVSSVFLEVRSSNQVAMGLYASRGFEVISNRADYYENGEDAIIMRLQTS